MVRPILDYASTIWDPTKKGTYYELVRYNIAEQVSKMTLGCTSKKSKSIIMLNE